MIQDESSTSLAIRLLGPFAVTVDGQPMPRLRTRKGRWLLAILALRSPRPVERSWLAGTLWPESTDEQALFNLRHSLTDLRRALAGQSFRIRRATKNSLFLDVSGAKCDVREFDEALRHGDLLSLRKAVDLYGGPLLEGCLEEWAAGERREKEEALLAALETLAQHSLRSGDPRAAAQYLQKAVAVDPLRESAQRLLMEALAAAGDYPRASAAYRAFRSTLLRELQVEPAPDTAALYRELRRPAGAPGEAVRTPGSALAMPRPLTSLVGRQAEIEEIAQLLAHSRLVTLVGSGGVGKTRLAIGVATDLDAQYPQGSWFVDLAALTDPPLVAQRICSALRLRESPGAPAFELLAAHLRSKHLLLVLDNCEHLIDECAQVTDRLLGACPEITVLATSREPLGVPGEHPWRVPSLPVPGMELAESNTGDMASAVATFASVRLFVDRAADQCPGFVLTRHNARAVAQICRQLDGIPLALELAAARVRALSVQQVASRLDGCFELLTGGARTSLPRHRTLRALIDWSYDLLSEQERRLLCHLAVFSGGWTLEAAEHVCSGEGIESQEILRLVGSLVDKSLVSFDNREGHERYRLLETTRSYARDLLRAAGEANAVEDRHADYYLWIAEESAAMAAGPTHAHALDRVQADIDNMRAALVWLFRGDGKNVGERGLRLAAAMAGYWRLRGHLREGRHWLQAAIDRSSDRTPARAAALLGLGRLLTGWSEPVGRTEYYRSALAIYEELGCRRHSGDALVALSYELHTRGDPANAREAAERALMLYQGCGHEHGIMDARDLLGIISFGEGDYAAARASLEESLAIALRAGDEIASLKPLNNLGLVAYVEGDHASAFEYHRRCLEIDRAIDNRVGVAWSLSNMGETALAMGDPGRARALQRESLERFVELDHNEGIPEVVRGLALIAAAEMKSVADARRAAVLFGAADMLRETLGWTILPYNRPEHDRATSRVEERLGAADYAVTFAEGRMMSRDQGIAFALESTTAAGPESQGRPAAVVAKLGQAPQMS